jgi:SAM-dependent methyltransferase
VDFHVADVLDLPAACAGPFDAVVMSYGVLCWLAELPAVMRVVRERLDAGGRFVLVDGHPLDAALADDPAADGWRLHGDYYFCRREPDRWECATSYTGAAPLTHAANYQWPHHVAEIVQAVLDAGLTLRALREEPFSFYRRFPGMTRREDGYWDLPAGAPRVPMLVALLATC